MQYLNPKRVPVRGIARIVTKYLITLGFRQIDFYYVHGEGSGNKLELGSAVSTMDATFNISSGNITVGDNTIFGHNVSVLTGFHLFHKGVRAKLASYDAPKEVPDSGHDIRIGRGCFLGTNCVILRGVTLGDNCIVGAGAIVTKSFPSGSIILGPPAGLFGTH